MVCRDALVEGAVMYAVLHPPNFAAQVVAQQRPELRKRPVALIDGEPPADTVVAANKAARGLGVEVGMTRLQAATIPEVVTIRRVHEDEVAAQSILHTIACMFSPRIEYVEIHPGTYALDIDGMNGMFGDGTRLANKLRQRIMTEGFLANVAVAQNFDAALCLALGRTGVSVVPPGDEAAALRDLPLHVLNLTAEQTETFQAWGIHTCGQLASLAETDLISRIGQAGKRLHTLARGAWPHLMFPVEPNFEDSLVERMELDFPVELLEPLLFLLGRMTDTLLERAKAKARAIASLRVVLHLNDGKRHERIVRPALSLEDKLTLLKLLQLDLETHPPNAAILSLELHAQSAVPYRAQHGLFLPQAPEPGRLEVLLARLRKLLGEERVGSVELKDDHRPNAFRVVPFAPPPPKRSEQRNLAVATALRVCRPPQMIGVAFTGSIPGRVFWDGQGYSVREIAGPWRVSGQWWSEANWCREEWDVRLATEGAERVCRIAFDPRSRCWYVQGTYD
jgi:protein ImuB